MFFSIARYTGNGSTSQFNVTFPYLEPGHVRVTVNKTPANFSWVTPTVISITPTPAAGATVEVRRATPSTQSVVDFQDGTRLTEEDLDALATFQLYQTQETRDIAVDIENQMIPVVAAAALIDTVGPLSAQTVIKADEAATSASQAQQFSATASSQAAAAGLSATNASNSASAAANSATNAGNSASAAQTSATSATNSASTATTQATNASSSASAAQTSATNAATSATNAATSATNAAGSATSAANSATAAANSAASIDTANLVPITRQVIAGSGLLGGGALSANRTVAMPRRPEWTTDHLTGTVSSVAGQMVWRNYGPGHVVVDASWGSIEGTSVNSSNSSFPWVNTYPTLVGWNGSSTYGVKVDRARVAEGFLTTTGTAAVFAARAWVNFASSGMIRQEGNIWAVTRNNVGDYTITFNTSMPDTNYAVSGTSASNPGTAGANDLCVIGVESTHVNIGNVRIYAGLAGGGNRRDSPHNFVVIHR
jgi:hypothetical protein